MADDIFNRLRSNNAATPPRDSSRYSFQGGAAPQQQPQSNFSSRPGTGPTITRPTTTTQVPGTGPVRAPFQPPRDASGDRPAAYDQGTRDMPPQYAPPAVRRREDEGDLYEWKPPGFSDILKDLGLRLLEVVIAAGAVAAGEEIAYFFKRRRFHADTRSRYTRD